MQSNSLATNNCLLGQMNLSIFNLRKISKWLLTACLLLTSLATFADSVDSVIKHFESKVIFINQSLKSNQQSFEESPALLAKFVDESLLPLWQASKTLTGLLGSNNWNKLTLIEQASLQKGFDDTIQRYVQEGFALYDGQSLEFVGVRLNENATRGLLTVKVIPNVMPSFEIDFKIFKNQDSWQLYDILVQGVSYISLKKDAFRTQLEKQGVAGILHSISDKNQGFIASARAPDLALNEQ